MHNTVEGGILPISSFEKEIVLMVNFSIINQKNLLLLVFLKVMSFRKRQNSY